MDDLTALFPDVADTLGIESVAIVEKDYYIVELLRLLQHLTFDTHQLVFAGGTALSKAGILLNRMSEDVDIKLVPTANFLQQSSRSQRKNIRKNIIRTITETIVTSGVFSFDDDYPKVTRDEYRYNEIPVRYPQMYSQIPCLRPFIKLELMETDLLESSETRDICSLLTDVTKKGEMVRAFPCATIVSTQAEKLISMMRRTAASMRDLERAEDESLVRHVYDNFCIVREKGVNVPALTHFIQECIEQDIERYGNQYPEFCESPIEELKRGLEELAVNPVYKMRYQQFLAPMVFGETHVSWEDAYSCFRQTALDVLQ
ncbi:MULTISPECIES: nucleotidyl transferase AbiEii/AbiGii toxin family protein [unclassified Brenneria]|uniref:nucleotidyl transferase AbiEii/AbiGii toxin family protein n=1 Tax=unclassified Brenneria TaxID=2634434 RepID=UPI0029C5A0D6|nr:MULTISPECIES: nucleotidyl transferase AbiEii/AbiGii toxin family protein [unclassified Brenneria]MDX5629547.1 nucleotidyl transferase AbiEii/AbiGii toxin family protein [Brenneria sp. L3-3Z]MDX5696686.1 nucleotidyl transferase AbiEii/AbiGii toxin family protein [Brenneria sp. L4-2C]